MSRDIEVEEICQWCENSGILIYDFDDHLTAGDECHLCAKPVNDHGLTLEEYEDLLKDRGYSEEEIKEELEMIEAQNENVGLLV